MGTPPFSFLPPFQWGSALRIKSCKSRLFRHGVDPTVEGLPYPGKHIAMLQIGRVTWLTWNSFQNFSEKKKKKNNVTQH